VPLGHLHISKPARNFFWLVQACTSLHKLEQAKKAGKGEKRQSDLFLRKKLISGYTSKVKKPEKV
jgi:hypothetical protein